MASNSAQGNGTPSGDGGHENKDLPTQGNGTPSGDGGHENNDLPTQGNGTPSGDGSHENKDLPTQGNGVASGEVEEVEDDLPTDGQALQPQKGPRRDCEPQKGRHGHKLQRKEDNEKYKCGGCKASGANVGYKCGTCSDFVLHESCACLADRTQHPRFPGQQLYFQQRTGRRKYCEACKEKLLGCVFETKHGQLKFHPLCLDIPDTFSHTDLGLDDQNRPYVFKRIINKQESVCMTCGRKTLKWKYHCPRYENGVYLDMNCALLHFHGLSFPNVERLQPTIWNRRILEMLSTGGRYVGDTLCRSFCYGLGEGTAMACCPLIYDTCCGNDDGDEEENGASEAGNAGDADGDGNDNAGQ